MDLTTGLLLIAVALGAFAAGGAVTVWVRQRRAEEVLVEARAEADTLRREAEAAAATYRKKHVEAAEAALQQEQRAFTEEQEEARKQMQRTRRKLDRWQQSLSQEAEQVNEQQQTVERAAEALERLQQEVDRDQQQLRALMQRTEAAQDALQEQRAAASEAEAHFNARSEALERKRERLQDMIDQQVRKLENVAGLSRREAREAMREQLLDEAKLEAASRIKEIRDEAKLEANREARRIVLTAIQRTAASHAIENTVSVVNIQSDEMKGRIIGREGRNIRAFEAATGIEVIVDDTPEAVILSGFDPVRREIARLAMIDLVQDGRIHPGRIEEVVDEARAGVAEEIQERGERAVIDLNLHGLHSTLVRHIGRMRYRTSYGQNLLAHSIETARIASLIAAELNLDPAKARRAGLLHDIGKVLEEEIEQPHALAGMELCQRYKEADDVCNAVGAHHDEIEMTTLIAPIVQAADAISGARPGARREALESYIKRLEQLEDLAASFDGVERVYAIQAGREVRVLVNHDLVSDARAEQLAADIARRIQDELQYPGQVKITVIREVRAVSHAK
ncbi:MAG: ribonuclease Y [Bacteroidetes bacterium]|jgi:ribonuclease Y|nr:ribonuclease Y [Bacteroidota bacterium]